MIDSSCESFTTDTKKTVASLRNRNKPRASVLAWGARARIRKEKKKRNTCRIIASYQSDEASHEVPIVSAFFCQNRRRQQHCSKAANVNRLRMSVWRCPWIRALPSSSFLTNSRLRRLSRYLRPRPSVAVAPSRKQQLRKTFSLPPPPPTPFPHLISVH